MKFGWLVAAAMAVTTLLAAAPVPKLELDYPVSCWTYYPFEKSLDWDYTIDNWVRLGINRPMSPRVTATTDKVKFRQFLDECAKVGLKLYVLDERIGNHVVRAFGKKRDEQAYRAACRAVKADWWGHPAVCGFYVYDEPEADQVDAVCECARIQREEIPGSEPFLNFLPWYPGCASRFGTKSLAPYLDQVKARSGIDMIGYDCYAHQSRSEWGMNVFFSNLREWGEFSRRSGCRWQTALLSAAHWGYELSSPEDYRWQISTAAAMGANMITWFFVDAHGQNEENYRNFPIDVFGERSVNFDWMGREMRTFQHRFGAEFARLNHVGAMMAGRTYGGIALFSPQHGVKSVEASAENPVLVSFFRDAAGVDYVAIVNLRQEPEKSSRRIKVEFDSGVTGEVRQWHRNLWSQIGGVFNGHMAAGQLELIRLRANRD